MQHSEDLAQIYRSCVELSTDRATTHGSKTLDGARHRYESLTSPLMKICQNPSAPIAFCFKVSLIRKGTVPGQACTAFLKSITEVFFILLAMLTDASLSAMHLIRLYDRSTVPVTKLHQEVGRFLDRVAWLFFGEGVLSGSTHTAFIIKWLGQGPHHILAGGEHRSLGPPSREHICQCLGHLRAWVVLAKEVVEAELPGFLYVVEV